MASLFQVLQFFDSNGDPLSGGKIYWYQAGTAVPKDTYTDQGAGTPAANPVILDTEGYPDHGSGAAGMWLDGSYKMVIKDSSDVTLLTLDDINIYDELDWDGLTATIADLNSTTTTALLKNSVYTVVAGDRGKTIMADATSGAFTINLLAAATAGNKFKIIIKKTDSSTNAVTIDPAGSETIDTQTTFLLYDFNDFIEVHCDGSNWKIVASQVRGTVRSITATATLALDDNMKVINADASGGAYAVNLPSAATVGRGFRVTIKKTDSSTNTVTVTPDGAETIDGSASFGIVNQYGAVSVISDGTNWSIFSEFGDAASGAAYPTGHFRGLGIQQATDTQHDIQINPGSARGENDLANIKIAVSATLIKQIDATWAAGTNAGGMPTGQGVTLTPSTWYHIFVIAKNDGTTDGGFDTDVSATNLLAEAGSAYVDYKRVGSLYADSSSNITDFQMTIQAGGLRRTYWKEPPLDLNAQRSSTPTLQTLSVPIDVKVIAVITGRTTCPPSTSNYSMRVFPTYVTDTNEPGRGMVGVGTAGLADNIDNFGGFNVETDTNAQVYVAVTVATGPVAPSLECTIVTWGWDE